MIDDSERSTPLQITIVNEADIPRTREHHEPLVLDTPEQRIAYLVESGWSERGARWLESHREEDHGSVQSPE